MKYFLGTVAGAMAGLFLVACGGAVWGGITRPLSCCREMTIFEGLEFGAIVVVMLFGLPATGFGAIAGLVGARFFRDHERFAFRIVPTELGAFPLPEDQDYWTKPDSDQVKRFEG